MRQEENTVIVVPVVKSRPWVNTEKYGKNKLKEAGTVIQVYIDERGVMHTGLSEEERMLLEKEMGLQPGSLEAKINNSYWHDNVNIKLKDEPNIFYKSNPKDRLYVSVLSKHPLVATSESDITASSEFFIKDSGADLERKSKKAEVKEEAIMLFSEMTADEKRAILKIYGKGGSDLTDKAVKSELFEDLEKDPEKFKKIAGLTKSVISIKALLFDLVEYGVLRKRADHYFDGDTDLGTIDDAAEYLLDPSKQSVLDAYRERLTHSKLG